MQLEENLSSLINDQQWKDIALLLNRRTTINNEKILDRLLKESHWRIPGSKDRLTFDVNDVSLSFDLDELLNLLIPPIRMDLIVHLRAALLIHQDNLSTRLQIHKTIFHIQQLDSL